MRPPAPSSRATTSIGRRARRLRILILAAALLPAPAWAQEPEVIILDPNGPLIQNPGTVSPGAEGSRLPETVTLAAPGADVREVLSGFWFRYDALQKRGDADGAARQAASALEFMKRQGLRGAPDIAGALLSEARRALDAGDYRRARESFTLAGRFEPGLPAAHFGLAATLLRGDRDLTGAVAEWWTGLRHCLTDPKSFYYRLGNAALIVYLGLIAGGTAALVLLTVRSVPALAHDLQERSGGRLSEQTARLAGWGLVALPVAAFLPFAWILALWSALFFTYFRGPERIVAITALLLLAAAGPSGRAVELHFGTIADPEARALMEAARGHYGPQQEQALQRLAKKHPDDALFPFLLASAYHAGGRLDDAMTQFRRVLEIDPRQARALVNLGNLHFLHQEFPLALEMYRRAGEADPTLALAHYNSHLAYLETFRLEAADGELKEARRRDDALVTELVDRAEEGRGPRSPVDAALPKQAIWRKAMRLRLQGGLVEEARRALTAPATLAGGAGLAAALFLPGIGLAPRSGAARRCRRCGRPFCRRCQVATKYPEHCSQCMHLFILRDGVAPGVKARKMEEVARYRRRLFFGGRLVNLALPGSGHIVAGRALLGASLLAAWGATWIGFALRGELLVSPEWIVPALGSNPVVGLAALALPIWLAGNLSSHESTPE